MPLKELWVWSGQKLLFQFVLVSLCPNELYLAIISFSKVALPVMVTGNLPGLISAQEICPVYCLPFSWVRKHSDRVAQREAQDLENPSWGGVKMQNYETGSPSSSQERFNFCSSHESSRPGPGVYLIPPKIIPGNRVRGRTQRALLGFWESCCGDRGSSEDHPSSALDFRMMTSGLHPHNAVALTLQTSSENAKKTCTTYNHCT